MYSDSVRVYPEELDMERPGYNLIDFKDVEYQRVIKSRETGCRNKVYEATWKSPGGPVRVAAKYCLHFKEEEASILAKLNHKNVIKFLGVLKAPPAEYVIVTEYADKGSLYDFIGLHREDWQEFKEPYWMKWALEGAKALQYIHHKGYQHGDVKSPNFVIMSDDTLKICDFGTTRQFVYTVSTVSVRGSWPWMAPEAMGTPYDSTKKPCKVTSKSDVFSFAVVLWELLTGKAPFYGLSPLEIQKTVAINKKCLEIPSDCPEYLCDLLKTCWDHDHRRRPSMDELLTTLNEYGGQQGTSGQESLASTSQHPSGSIPSVRRKRSGDLALSSQSHATQPPKKMMSETTPRASENWTGVIAGQPHVEEEPELESNSGTSHNPQEARRLSIQRVVQNLVHACHCRDANCRLPSCQKMKRVVQHTKVCERKTNGECPICKQLIALCCYHAKHCQEQICLVPFCLAIKHKLKQKEKVAVKAHQ